MENSIPQIVMIENNTTDAALTTSAMEYVGVQADFIVFKTIEDGFDYLEDVVLPSLVILNKFDEAGCHFLQMLRNNPRFEKLNIFVLTTDPLIKDKDHCKSLDPIFFIYRPMMVKNLVENIDVLKPFLTLPNRAPAQ